MSTGYRSYLLRMWQEGSGWRFTLTSLGDDGQRGFASLEKLVEFVQSQMAEKDLNEEERKEST